MTPSQPYSQHYSARKPSTPRTRVTVCKMHDAADKRQAKHCTSAFTKYLEFERVHHVYLLPGQNWLRLVESLCLQLTYIFD